ncbi:holo-ACP synthase [bacterium]|nr:holo-ACP synthase [bacterium]
MNIGIDIQNIPEFKKSYKRTGEEFLQKIFTKKELNCCKRARDRDMEYLCGRFCAKEAAIKAGVIGIGEWQKIEVIGDKSQFSNFQFSLSHSGDYCVAVVVSAL